VWYHAPHHIGGGIVCSRLLIVCLGAHSWQCPLVLTLGMCACVLTHGIRACSLCAWALTLGSVLSCSLLACVRVRSLMASCLMASCPLCARSRPPLRLLAAARARLYVASCMLTHGIVSSLRSLAAASALARGRLRLYVASCVCATTQRCCCTNCTSCHVQMINVEQ